MILNEYGRIVQTVWNELPQHYDNVELGEFIAMPNHIHGIVIITDSHTATTTITPISATKKHSFPEIIRALKTFSARKINELRNMPGEKIWQRNYYEHIIRNEQSHQRIANYIMNNPANWEKDKFYAG